MNLVTNRTLHPHLRDEEALVVENAIRLAIDSIVNVLYGVNSARTSEYQRMVGDRDREIQRLECRLKELEHNLQAPRHHGCTCGWFEKASSIRIDARTCTEPHEAGQSELDPSYTDAEMTAVPPECEMNVPLSLFARPSSHLSSQSHESSLPLSPNRIGLDQSGTPHSSESSSGSETTRNLPTSPSFPVVKEEPCDMSTVFIKWEMSEEGLGEHQESADAPSQDKESPGEKKDLEDGERGMFREVPHTVPDRHHITEGAHLRNKKKTVPMSELPEEAQRIKRAAWRAASRRYYARKIARQQANPSHVVPFTHVTDSQYSQTISLADRQRKTLISELPDECQTLQREAWRAASRRYYARKIARHQREATQYVHLLQNMEQSEETLGANTGGPHTNDGGILCS